MSIETIMRAFTDFIRLKLRDFIIGILNQVYFDFIIFNPPRIFELYNIIIRFINSVLF